MTRLAIIGLAAAALLSAPACTTPQPSQQDPPTNTLVVVATYPSPLADERHAAKEKRLIAMMRGAGIAWAAMGRHQRSFVVPAADAARARNKIADAVANGSLDVTIVRNNPLSPAR